MNSTFKMVKFFTQTCPKCQNCMTTEVSSSQKDANKCLCIVKGQMIPARGFAGRKKDPSKDDPTSSTDPVLEDEREEEDTKEKKKKESPKPKKDDNDS